MDELSNCVPSVQASLLRLVHDGVCGDYVLDLNRVAIVAAANSPETAANGQELSPPMANRFTHFKFPCSAAAALEWAEKFPAYWGRPPVVQFNGKVVPEEHMLVARSFVAGFIRRRPELWHASLAGPARAGKGGKKEAAEATMKGDSGWESARSWYRASTHIGRALALGLPVSTALRPVAGAVGEGSGLEFTTYAHEASLPDPEAVLRGAETYKPSGRLDVDFTVLLAVGAAVLNDPTPDRFTALLTVCNRAAAHRGDSGPAYEAATAVIGVIRPLTDEKDERYIFTKIPKRDIAAYTQKLMRLADPFKALLKALGSV